MRMMRIEGWLVVIGFFSTSSGPAAEWPPGRVMEGCPVPQGRPAILVSTPYPPVRPWAGQQLAPPSAAEPVKAPEAAPRPGVFESYGSPSSPPGVPAAPPPSGADSGPSHYFNSYVVSASGAAEPAASSGPCSVSFWNLAGKSLALKVNGKGYAVERGRPLTVEVPRQFVWQVENREPEAAQVAPGENAMEIVIRR